MQIIRIPKDLPDFIQTIQLDDGHASYPVRIHLRWNDRLGDSGMWIISFYKTTGEALRIGIPLVAGMNLTSRLGIPELGKGHLYCFHVDETIKAVSREDLYNQTAKLYYLEDSEYDSLT